MSEWKAKTIADLGKVVTGSTPPSRNPGWFGESTPFVTPSDMTDGDRRPRPGRWLSDEGRAGLRTRLVPPDSVAFVCIGATIGKVCLLPSESVTNQQVNTVIPGDDMDGRFIYYLLRHVAPSIAQAASGAATPIINKSAFSNVLVHVPGYPTQSRIGEVLGCLDDLIENNRRRVEVLEEMARAIYREWFAKFRYPGHEDVPLVDSALGPIPDGWQVAAISDVATVDKGLSYKGAFLTGPGVPMANLKCIAPNGGFRRHGTKPYSGPFQPRHAVSPDDLVLANTDLTQAGTVIGSPAFVPRRGFEEGGLLSHHLFAVREASPELVELLYHDFAGQRFRAYARGVASGTTVLGFRAADLLAYRFALPPADILESFAGLAGKWRKLASDLTDSVESLEQMRELLLPRLVTGQFDVSALDLDVLIADRVA